MTNGLPSQTKKIIALGKDVKEVYKKAKGTASNQNPTAGENAFAPRDDILITGCMAIVLKYKEIARPSPLKPTKAPVAPVVLHGKSGNPIYVVGVIDSGADITAVPKGIADLLELDFPLKQKRLFREIDITFKETKKRSAPKEALTASRKGFP